MTYVLPFINPLLSVSLCLFTTRAGGSGNMLSRDITSCQSSVLPFLSELGVHWPSVKWSQTSCVCLQPTDLAGMPPASDSRPLHKHRSDGQTRTSSARPLINLLLSGNRKSFGGHLALHFISFRKAVLISLMEAIKKSKPKLLLMAIPASYPTQ